jgi:hypothetical protein
MTIDDFRRIAVSMPGAEELNGMGYPNFRADRMSFATIEDVVPVIRLTRDQQATFVAAAPEMFAPASDGWGKWGSTIVRLEAADEATLREALTTAWRNVTNSAAEALNVADTTSANTVHDADIATKGATTVADVNDVTHIDVLDAAANVASDVTDEPAVDVAYFHNANVADVDDTEVVHAGTAEGPDAANRTIADVVSFEPRDDLRDMIEQLQEYWRQESAK